MKLRDHNAIVSKGDAFRVDPRQLQIEPGFNVRDLDAPTAREALDELKNSIKAEGVQVPLEIRIAGETLYVVSGHQKQLRPRDHRSADRHNHNQARHHYG